jgi:hypothetical protein
MHRLSPRFLRAHMKLVQLSPQSIESLMNQSESLPLSLDDLLTEIPINWREPALSLHTKSAQRARLSFKPRTPQAAHSCLNFSVADDVTSKPGSCGHRRARFFQALCTSKRNCQIG